MTWVTVGGAVMVFTAAPNSWPTSLPVDEQKIAVVPTTPSLYTVRVLRAEGLFGPLPASSAVVPLPFCGFSRDANCRGLHEYSSDAC